jgi:hypothetical protein
MFNIVTDMDTREMGCKFTEERGCFEPSRFVDTVLDTGFTVSEILGCRSKAISCYHMKHAVAVIL